MIAPLLQSTAMPLTVWCPPWNIRIPVMRPFVKFDVQPFLHSLYVCPTHRRTDHATCDICSNRPHLVQCVQTMRTNNISETQWRCYIRFTNSVNWTCTDSFATNLRRQRKHHFCFCPPSHAGLPVVCRSRNTTIPRHRKSHFFFANRFNTLPAKNCILLLLLLSHFCSTSYRVTSSWGPQKNKISQGWPLTTRLLQLKSAVNFTNLMVFLTSNERYWSSRHFLHD